MLLARFCGNAETYDLQTGKMRFPALKPPPTLLNAAYSPDGRRLVTVSQTSVACIWDATSFQQIRQLPHQSQLWGARFSPDGLRLVTAASDGVARVWDTKTGKLLMALKQHTDAIHFAEFSHNGRLIVTASHDTTAQLWNAETGQPVGAPLAHGAWVMYAAFSPDDEKLVTASLDRKARVWETATGRRLLPDLDHPDGVQSAEFSPDGRWILTASADGTARLWLANRLQPLAANPILRQGSQVNHACFSPDGRCILTTCADGSARIWDLAGNASAPSTAPRTLSPDGNLYLTVSTNSVQVWNTAFGQAVCPPIIPKPTMIAASLCGRFLLTTSSNETANASRTVQVWDVGTGRPQGPGLLLSNLVAGVAGLSISEQGQRMVVSDGNLVQAWNVLTGLPLSPPLSFNEPAGLSRFSHDGNKVATISGHEVKVWDARSGRAVFKWLTLSQPVQDAQFSPDDKYLATCCSDNLLTACYAQVYSAVNGHPIGPRLNHRAGVLSCGLQPREPAGRHRQRGLHRDGLGLRHGPAIDSAAQAPEPGARGRVQSGWPMGGDGLAGQDRACLGCPERVASDPAPAKPRQRLPGQDFLPTNGTSLWPMTKARHRFGTCWWTRGPYRTFSHLPACFRAPRPRHLPGLRAVLQNRWKLFGSASGPNDPADFATAPEEIAAWHEFEAQDSESQGQWSAAAFHLQHLMALRPGDKSLAGRLARARDQVHIRN